MRPSFKAPYGGLSLAVALCGCGGEPPRAPVQGAEVWIPHLPPAGKDTGQRDNEPRERKRALARAPRQPNHFWFLDVRRDETGERREWVRADASTWEERWASGAVMRYRVVGKSSEIGLSGVIVRRVPDGLIEVLVPDMGPEVWAKMRVVPNGDWHPLGLVHPID